MSHESRRGGLYNLQHQLAAEERRRIELWRARLRIALVVAALALCLATALILGAEVAKWINR